MIDETICPDCRHPVNCHHDGTGVWGKGCNQPLAMELQCPCQKTYATFNALNALAAELKQLRNIIAFYGIEIMPDGSFTSPRITQNEVDVTELREFVGAMKVLADLAQDVCDVFCPVNEREELAYRKLREALRPYTEAK